MSEPIIDPNAAEVIADLYHKELWEDDDGRHHRSHSCACDLAAQSILAALSARGLSVVQLEAWDGNGWIDHGKHLGREPLYRVIPVGEKPDA